MLLYLGISGGQSLLQHWDNFGENPLSELPNEVTESASGNFPLVGVFAGEAGQQEGDEGGEDLTQRADRVSDHNLPHVQRSLSHHQSHIRPERGVEGRCSTCTVYMSTSA